MTFGPLTSNSDLSTDYIFHQLQLDTELDLHRITSNFNGAFATGVACKQGILTLQDTWIRLPLLGLANAPVVKTNFPELAVSFPDFSP